MDAGCVAPQVVVLRPNSVFFRFSPGLPGWFSSSIHIRTARHSRLMSHTILGNSTSTQTTSLEAIVQVRKLIGFRCVTAVLVLSLAPVAASAESPLAVRGAGANTAAKAGGNTAASSTTIPVPNGTRSSLGNAAYLVREVVYNELHDHDTHGYWRYWIERHASNVTEVQEAVETPDGPIARLELSNGQPISASVREDEDRRLQHLLISPGEQAQHRKEYADDEHRIGRILALLPDAFLYEPVEAESEASRMPECPCFHLHFRPNPESPAHSIESRIFHAMTGDLWISVDHKRLVRLDGKLRENVDFGFGILGRLYKDGWFRLERTHVNGADGSGSGSGPGNGDWKTERLEVHMLGRAMLFKTIACETSEVRGGFTPVPSGLTLQQAAALVLQPDAQPASPRISASMRIP
jgi:hypothetical protein